MKRTQRGITLIELIVVVTIVGLLAAIAIPSYRQYMIRAHRTEAKTRLLQLAQALERCYTNSTPYAYDSAVCAAEVPFPAVTEGGFYSIDTTNLTATQYSLLATRQAGQNADTICGDLSITETGVRGITGTGTVADCWRR